MDRLPRIHRRHQPYMPLFALNWARRRIPAEHEVLLSNKSAFCIGARGQADGARHICYCLTPTRFTYDFDAYAQRERIPAGASIVLRAMNSQLRRWETGAAQRVTGFVAISREVQERIRRYYDRDSALIYPPVDMPPPSALGLQPAQPAGGYYLIASRLLPYKRIDLAVEAFGGLGLPLLIAGDGRDRPRLEQLIAAQRGGTVKLLGRVSDDELHALLAGCRAFVFPGFEDFGIAPIRAMAYGKPVIAYAAGGALDTVVDGHTGTLFGAQTAEVLAEAVHKNSEVTFAPVEIRRHAEQFGVERFKRELTDYLASLGIREQ
jgi:glycosyltransferase involved in cell wall biosynthesis